MVSRLMISTSDVVAWSEMRRCVVIEKELISRKLNVRMKTQRVASAMFLRGRQGAQLYNQSNQRRFGQVMNEV